MSGRRLTGKDARKKRTRTRIARSSSGRARLSVFRSSKNISAQIIDDRAGHTLVSASSLSADLRPDCGALSGVEAAEKVGTAIARKAVAAGIRDVVFDRGAYIYHGRIRVLADAARAAGLNF